jgi:DNA adenine methylase
MPGYRAAYADRIPPAARRIAGVSLECRPALELIAAYGKHPNVLLYCDPPYLGSTRGWGNQYRHELRTDEQHVELAAALRGCAASVVLSGYPSPLYDELYAGWHRDELSASTGNGGAHRARTEVLWSNRPFPVDERLFSTRPA